MKKFLLVLSTVLITISTSLILDYAAWQNQSIDTRVAALLAAVIVINFLKFSLWGWIHKHFDVSKTYPITAIFFPLILIVSIIKGEAEVTWLKLVGVLLITLGLILFHRKKQDPAV